MDALNRSRSSSKLLLREKATARAVPTLLSAEVSRLADCTISEKGRFHKWAPKKSAVPLMQLSGSCPAPSGLIGWLFAGLELRLEKIRETKFNRN